MNDVMKVDEEELFYRTRTTTISSGELSDVCTSCAKLPFYMISRRNGSC
jgi:hypothetical protein